MLPVYKCLWRDDEKPTQKLTKSLCSWSSKNWIAYTNGYGNESPLLDINTVYIMNPDSPWENCTINTQHKGIVEHLEWDPTGNYLLSVDKIGMGKIWCQENSVINRWKCLDSTAINFNDGGRISKIAWLNDSTNQFQLDIEKITKKEWFYKFNQNKSDILSTLNKESNFGFVAVTFEGFVKLIFIGPKDKRLISTTRLGSLRSNIKSADFIVNDMGKLFVAAVTDSCMVELFSVSFKEAPNGVEINAEVWPCIVPYIAGEASFQDYTIEAVRCVKRCNPGSTSDQILVLSKMAHTSSVKVYEIKKEQVLLHQRFQAQNQAGQQADACFCSATFQFPNVDIVHMASTNLHFTNITKMTDQTLLPKLVLLDSSGTLRVYSLFTFQQIGAPSTVQELKQDIIDSSVFSSGDHAFFAISHQGNPMMLLLPSILNPQEKTKANKVNVLLHSCITTSSSPWDLMLSLSSCERHVIDQCLQQFTNEFTESAGNLQSLFYQRFCHFKALFFAVTKDYKGVFESYNMALLHNVFYHLTATLQSEKEINLLEKIHNICAASKKEFELTKILSVLDTKDITFTLMNNVLFRPMIQWVTDYMIHIVRLILSTSHHLHDWKSVLQYFDASIFLMLRKLCVLFYILYQKSTLNIQPIYVTMVNSSEVLPQLFKMVSKLYAVSLGDLTAGEAILNDLPFSSLPMMYLEYPSQDPRGTVLSQTTLTPKTSDFNYYDIQLSVDDWDVIHHTALSNPLTMGIQAVNTQQRQIYDGVNFTPASLISGEELKQCCQCGTLTIYNSHQTRVVNELWSSCWIQQCICGGKWKKVL